MKNLITSGCSFTQDGIGGLPPTLTSEGGSSFLDGVDFTCSTPRSWASHIAKELKIKSFVNTAASSHGNMLGSITITELISNYNYTSDDTLIVFNITNFSRYDILCNYYHNDVSTAIPWNKELLDFGFISRHNQLYKNSIVNITDKNVIMLSKNYLKMLFEFLNNNNYEFYFLWMEDYSTVFNSDKFLKKYLDRLITLENHNNMIDFCLSKKQTISPSDNHPSNKGHKLISNIVLEKLK